jgi:hypothetical protein
MGLQLRSSGLRARSRFTGHAGNAEAVHGQLCKSLALYREKLAEVKRGEKPNLPNTNFDTGEPARPGAYRLADDAAAELSKILAAN